ncbi:GNAT family N-acetyltransferase [Streptococcus cuniculipharyngis]|uniref:GNAT family N-acetyltransferase n=1 Tax=Streptococcus cuniculipharyngis TaxID=1562651 RepID=A0A5C5SGY8_9STRE|nr:GNAT family N-acetyltransferase [Streptococcus cuniculipharyngis]TWS99205.1 GNAT family N-acetyltransferase [Streptococcus cuniculipharyngis]
MKIRPAIMADFDQIMTIYAQARQLMIATGNPNQWAKNNWPPADLVKQDILSGKSYVCETEQIVGVFYYDFGKDIEPSYATIDKGAWQDDTPYGVIHRLASNGKTKGVGQACIQWALAQNPHLRIDTHLDNLPMQKLLAKLNFQQCGLIYVPQDSDPRLAYEKS